MKNKFLKILSKPKTIIPITAIIGIIVVIALFNNIGKAPVVNVTLNTSSQVVTSGNSVDLSFPKTGRVSDVFVKNGQTVQKGEILAKLSAPDQEGAVSQAKGALDLAEAQYASLNAQYASTKKQQDLIVQNAYEILLSSGLQGTPSQQDPNIPVISGTYSCGNEGSYKLYPFASNDSDTGFSFKYSGLENGIAPVKYDNPVPLGTCGLQILFTKVTLINTSTVWTISIPNVKSPSYLANYNAYQLAQENRDKILSDLSTTLGNDSTTSVEKAQVSAARGAYDAAVGAYQNNLIVAPQDGTVNFIDKDLIVGQSVTPNKTVISITTK